MTLITAARFRGIPDLELLIGGARLTPGGFDSNGDLAVDRINDPATVEAIQAALIDLGYELVKSGVYNIDTEEAVRRFKNDQKLALPAGLTEHDGVTGRGTMTRLNELFTDRSGHVDVVTFFDDYARALLARDAEAIAVRYAVPALILFPGQPIAVTSPSQTAEFFTQAFAQYEGITQTSSAIDIAATADHSVWADVTWTHDNGTSERMMYQLVETADGWKIAVLTPLE